MQFTLGSPQAPAAAALAHAPGLPIPGHPAGYGPTRSSPHPSPPEDEEFEEVGRRSRAERDPDAILPARGTNKLQVFILAGIAAVLMAGSGLAIFFAFVRRGTEAIPADKVKQLQGVNVSLEPLPGWTRDDETRVKVGDPYILSYHRASPEAYIVFGAREAASGRSPRPSDMTAALLQGLPQLFLVTREENTLRPEPPAASSWLGEAISQSAPYPNGFKFRAQDRDGLSWMGEAYTVAHKGIAYYWLGWTLETDYEGLKDELAQFRGKIKLLDLRKDWKETQSNVADFKGDKVPYTLSDADEVWKEIPSWQFADLHKAEPELDKRLEINRTPRRDRKALPDEAKLSVYILDTPGDPLEVAKTYVKQKEEARIKTGGEFTVTIDELTDAEQGDPVPQTVPANTPAVRLKSSAKEQNSPFRLFVVSGIRVGDKTVVVECWCEYAKRSTFEARFLQIAKSLR
jgi:hypothetical protein